jgi:hypothetical protein
VTSPAEVSTNLIKYLNNNKKRENIACFHRFVGCCVVSCDVICRTKIFSRIAQPKTKFAGKTKVKGA